MGRLVQHPEGRQEAFPRHVRWLGTVWVALALVLHPVAAAFVRSPDGYVFVFVFVSCGAFTTPALLVTWRAARHTMEPRDRVGHMLSLAALATVYSVGVGMLIGLVTPWRWANVLGVPAVALAALLHLAGLVTWTRVRSGGRALLVDVVDALTSVLAVTAPLVVLWGPAIVRADASWFAVPAAVATLGTIAATYWAVALFVRVGSDRGAFETGVLVLTTVGALNAALQTAQGVSGFTLPGPALIALNTLCFSMYLLIPLHSRILFGAGRAIDLPQARVHGARLAAVLTFAGLVALSLATFSAADAHSWAVPFSFVVVSLLLVLVGVRQVATAQETRGLYRQLEEAFEERRRLLTQLLDYSVDDRRRFAGQLYAQTVAAYTSFTLMSDSGVVRSISPSATANVSARVGDDLARQATSVQKLTLAVKPLDSEHDQRVRLQVPIQAYLASIYGNRTPPRLTVDVENSPTFSPDWMTETVLLQIIEEALHNVWQHSQATRVEVAIQVTEGRVGLRVTDDGTGFDPAAVVEGPGITKMRAATAVSEGTLNLDSHPGRGTTVLAHLGPEPPDDPPQRQPSTPNLRIVPNS